MEQYFVTGLSDDERKVCRRFKIKLVDMTIGRREGWVVSDRHLHRMCDKLSKRVTFLERTSYEGIIEATLGAKEVPADFTPQVKTEYWDGEGKSEFKKIAAKTLALALRIPVVLEVPHGSHCNPYNDGSFHVLIWSSPKARKSVSTPNVMWGISVSCTDDSFEPSSDGIVIKESESHPVAEIIGKNLYIFHDACHRGFDSEFEIFQLICNEAVFLLTMTQEERAEHEKEIMQKSRERSRAQYAELCKKRVVIANEKLKTEIEQLTRDVQGLTEKLIQRTRDLDLARKALDKLNKSTVVTEDMIKEFGDEFDQYFLNDLILDVIVRDDRLEILTDVLYCEDPRTKILHELGKFRVVIYTHASSIGVISIFNLTRTISGNYRHQQAGHVDSDGKPCLGNGAEIVAELCASRDFVGLANYLIAYLQSVNVDDGAGKYINYFPEAKIQPSKKKTKKAKKAAVAA